MPKLSWKQRHCVAFQSPPTPSSEAHLWTANLSCLSISDLSSEQTAEQDSRLAAGGECPLPPTTIGISWRSFSAMLQTTLSGKFFFFSRSLQPASLTQLPVLSTFSQHSRPLTQEEADSVDKAIRDGALFRKDQDAESRPQWTPAIGRVRRVRLTSGQPPLAG